MKYFYKTMLAVYLLFLVWLILFKTSSNPISVLEHYKSRSLNLVPFGSHSFRNPPEMIANLVAFVPLGLSAGVVYKRIGIWQKLAWIAALSILMETLQYMFAIGSTDITDVIVNTLGGLLGLMAYGLVGGYVAHEKLNLCIVFVLSIVLAAALFLRFMVFKVQY